MRELGVTSMSRCLPQTLLTINGSFASCLLRHFARAARFAGRSEHCAGPALKHDSDETSRQNLVNTKRSELLFFDCACLGTLFRSVKKASSVRPSSKFDSNGVGACLCRTASPVSTSSVSYRQPSQKPNHLCPALCAVLIPLLQTPTNKLGSRNLRRSDPPQHRQVVD